MLSFKRRYADFEIVIRFSHLARLRLQALHTQLRLRPARSRPHLPKPRRQAQVCNHRSALSQACTRRLHQAAAILLVFRASRLRLQRLAVATQAPHLARATQLAHQAVQRVAKPARPQGQLAAT